MTRSAQSYVSDSVTFTPQIIEATKAYARSKPWSGSDEDKREKLIAYHRTMCAACEVNPALLFVDGDFMEIETLIAMANDSAEGRAIVIEKISVVTYLYLLAAVIYGERDNDRQMTFAVNLYKQGFPRSFAARDLSGPMVR